LPLPSLFTLRTRTAPFPLSLHDALPILVDVLLAARHGLVELLRRDEGGASLAVVPAVDRDHVHGAIGAVHARDPGLPPVRRPGRDRKSTRLNSSHVKNSYAVFCLKKKIF